MKEIGNKTLGQYINKFPFNKTNVHTVNIFMDNDESKVLSVTVPRFIWHMNVTDAINDMDKNLYNYRVNTFDQKVMRTSIDFDGEFRTLNIYIQDYYYKYSPMLISSETSE